MYKIKYNIKEEKLKLHTFHLLFIISTYFYF